MAILCALACGCVQRRLTIRSDPPGALVYVDNFEIGTTPVSTSFIYYGTREIRLVKDGYETLTVMQPIPPPWYQIPPLDFFSENVVPGEIRDQRVFSYRLAPQMIAPPEQLLERAQQLRGRATASGAVLTAPGVTGAPLAPAPGGPVPETLPTPVPGPQSLPPAGAPAPAPSAPTGPMPGGTAPYTLPPAGPAPYSAPPSGQAPGGSVPFTLPPAGPSPYLPPSW